MDEENCQKRIIKLIEWQVDENIMEEMFKLYDDCKNNMRNKKAYSNYLDHLVNERKEAIDLIVLKNGYISKYEKRLTTFHVACMNYPSVFHCLFKNLNNKNYYEQLQKNTSQWLFSIFYKPKENCRKFYRPDKSEVPYNW